MQDGDRGQLSTWEDCYLTSGKVPLEKTLSMARSVRGGDEEQNAGRADEDGDLHQQTGLTAGTVTDDDQLSADLSHCVAKV